ncbi:MAG: hypothetical protein DSY55_03990 [Clostridia bacterium]|nr:MAG: hypothetical protein DSY55_03990 [Clostridia bacterium]
MKERTMDKLQTDAKLLGRLQSFQKISLIVGVLALIVLAAGFFLDTEHFFAAYLVGWVFWIQVALGGLLLLLIQNTVGGRWGLVIQRISEAATMTLPLLAVLFLVILIGIPHLYHWADADAVAHDTLLQAKAPYLNVPFFIVRAVIYFVIWIGAAYLLRKWSAQLDDNPDDADLRKKLRNLSAPGILIFGFTVTFASVDWMMSLEPHWYSTIYGMTFGVSAMAAGFAFAVVLVMWLLKFKPWSEVVLPLDVSDLGNWLLASIMLWAYLVFSQFLIIWSANLPEETTWYLARTQGGWQWVAIINVTLHFFLPFFFLLARGTKRAPGRLFKIAALVLIMRFADLVWRIIPAFSPGKLTFPWLSVVAWIAIGGLFMTVFFQQLTKANFFPTYDSRLAVHAEKEEATSHVS